MSAVKASSATIDEPTLEGLRAIVFKTEATIMEIGKRVADSRLNLTELRADRRRLVAPARAKGDALAQKTIRDIDEQITQVGRDIEDDETALGDLRERLVSERNAVALAEWEEDRKKVRAGLETTLQSGAGNKIQRLARDLAAALDEAKAEDERLVAQLTKFEPNLYGPASDLGVLARIRSEGVMFELMRQLNIDRRAFYGASPEKRDLAACDSNFYGRVLEALNRLELVF